MWYFSNECLYKTPSSLRATEMERIMTPNSPMYPYAPRILLAGSVTEKDNTDNVNHAQTHVKEQPDSRISH